MPVARNCRRAEAKGIGLLGMMPRIPTSSRGETLLSFCLATKSLVGVGALAPALHSRIAWALALEECGDLSRSALAIVERASTLTELLPYHRPSLTTFPGPNFTSTSKARSLPKPPLRSPRATAKTSLVRKSPNDTPTRILTASSLRSNGSPPISASLRTMP